MLDRAVEFMFNGNDYSIQYVAEGGKIVAPQSPSEIGYTFLGWGESESASSYRTFPYTPVSANETLYAVMQEVTLPYILFSSASSFTIQATKSWDGIIEMSTDAVTWTTWNGATATAVLNSGRYYLFFRGTNNTIISFDSPNIMRPWSISGTKVKCVGNIENLLDYTEVQNGNHPTMGEYCFCGLFKDCDALIKSPSLPALNLSSYCYAAMFDDCDNLTKPPVLPATTLASGCYSSMFSSCSELTTAPALPATTLTEACYASMFYGCSSLKAAPALPATALVDMCYKSMFKKCYNMKTAPNMSATVVAEYCCYEMFMGCYMLTAAPALPATTMAFKCYYSMFEGCHQLTAAPALPATMLAEYCYYCMFFSCVSLVTVPNLPATELAEDCYWGMFAYCDDLQVYTSSGSGHDKAWRIPTQGDTESYTTQYNLFRGTVGDYAHAYEVPVNATFYTQNAPV